MLEDILYQHINIISQWSLTCVTPAPNAYHELQLSAGDQSCCTPTVNVHTRQKKSARKDLKVVVLVTWCCCLLYILVATYYAVNILDSVHEDHISYMLHVWFSTYPSTYPMGGVRAPEPLTKLVIHRTRNILRTVSATVSEFFLDVFRGILEYVAHLKHFCRLGLTWKGHSFYPFRTGHSNLERYVVEILKARSLQASSRTADLFWLLIYNLYLYLYFSIRHKIKSTKKLAGCAVLGQLLRF